MNRTFDSDSDPTMIANHQFNEIMNQIQNSGLNFQLQISPFGAVISLKKSLVKDKKGSFILPSSIISGTSNNKEDFCVPISKNHVLENKLAALENKYKSAVDECKAAHKDIEAFKTEINVLKSKEVELQNETIKPRDCVHGKMNHSGTDQETTKAYEIGDYEVDLNYNVRVSNPFSPLLQLESSSEVSSVCDSHQTPISRNSPPPFMSPHTPSGNPPSPRTPAGQRGCFESSHPPSPTPAKSLQAEEARREPVNPVMVFEGKPVSTEFALKKIKEAFEEINNHFRP